MVSICLPQSPLLSLAGSSDIHLPEAKSFTVIGKYFFFKTLLHFLGEFLRKLSNCPQLQMLILNLLAFVYD